SLVLVAIGGGLGVAFAVWGSKLIATYAPPAILQGFQIGVDGRVLLFSAALTAITAIAISLVPALQPHETGLAGSLRDEGRGMTGSVLRQRGRRALVVSEIALAVIVATGAGLMVKSLVNAQNTNPGFDPSNLVSFRLGLLNYRYATPEKIIQFEQSMLERLRALPGVSSATIASSIPMTGLSRIAFSVEGSDFAKVPVGTGTLVFPGFFETLRIPLRAGQAFTGQETAQSPSVAVINETLARQYFPGVDPVGRRIKWGSPTSPRAWSTIVGVAVDVKAASLDAPVEPAIYFPAIQTDTVVVDRMLRGMSYVVRTEGDPQAMFNTVRRVVKEADPELPIVGLRTLDEIVSRSVAGRRFNTTLLGAFAMLGLALAATGIYGLMAYAVVQRTREIGIRLAIGATPFDVLRLVVGQASRVAAVGIAIGLAGSFFLTRSLEALLFDVSPLDPFTFGVSAFVLLAVATLASYLPARRAARIDPQAAIRVE
ncbi:MAG TPA: FtsX-like permease family protein, partial [Gemmatimonadaceae bacterium]